jgi:hypothetical protein
MIIQVLFNSPDSKHPKPPGGTIPAGLPEGFDTFDVEVKSTVLPEPFGVTLKEAFVQILEAPAQSPVFCEYPEKENTNNKMNTKKRGLKFLIRLSGD